MEAFLYKRQSISGSVKGKKFLDQSKENHESPNLFSLPIAGYRTAVYQE